VAISCGRSGLGGHAEPQAPSGPGIGDDSPSYRDRCVGRPAPGRRSDGRSQRSRLDAPLKAKVALEALRNEATIAELAAKHQLHPNQIYARKKQLLGGAAAVFAGGTGKEAGREAAINELLRQDRPNWLWSGIFHHGGPDDERAGRVAIVDRGRADLSLIRPKSRFTPGSPRPKRLRTDD